MNRKRTDRNGDRLRNMRKLNVRHRRMRSRTEHMRSANRVCFCLLVIAVCIAVPVSALPLLSQAKQADEHFEQHWQQKIRIAAEGKDQVNREYKAIEQDPHYLEIKARERLRWSKPGERIFVFPATQN